MSLFGSSHITHYWMHTPSIVNLATHKFSQEEFESLAEDRPDYLYHLLKNSLLSNTDTFFAAEAVQKTDNFPQFIPLLVEIISNNPFPPAREGAIYGLTNYLTKSIDLREKLRFVADEDSSPGVRTAASEALEYM